MKKLIIPRVGAVLLIAGLLSCGLEDDRDILGPLPELSILQADSPELPSALVGIPYFQQFLAQGGTGEYSWSLGSGSLPQGVSLSTDGVLSGIPVQEEASSFEIEVRSGGLTKRAPMTLGVTEPLTILDSTPSVLLVGRPVTFSLTSRGGLGDPTWILLSGAFPPGLTLRSSGVVEGVPEVEGEFRFTVQVRSGLEAAERELEIRTTERVALLGSRVTLIPDPRFLPGDGRRKAAFLVPGDEDRLEDALYLALSPDVASDSLVGYPASTGAAAIIRLQVKPALGGEGTDTLVGYEKPVLSVSQRGRPFEVAATDVPAERPFCGQGWGFPCPTGQLRFVDRNYAYYEDVDLSAGDGGTDEFYQWVEHYNRELDPLLERIWGESSDVDGDRRIAIFMTNRIGRGGFMWNSCMGPGPVRADPSSDCYHSLFERFNAGPVGSLIETMGTQAAAAFFAVTQTTDAQEVIAFTQVGRYSGVTVLSDGVWAQPLYGRHYTGERALGNGISFMIRNIYTSATDTLPDGVAVDRVYQADGWRFSCLKDLRDCQVNGDRYMTPGMFGYWLWQHLGDGVGLRYEDAIHGDYWGDIWEQAYGLRGSQLFNLFFLSVVLDDTPLGTASTLEFPENAVPEKLPDVREQMHRLAVGEPGVFAAPYAGPQVVQVTGLEPGVSYVIEVEYLSAAPVSLTVVLP